MKTAPPLLVRGGAVAPGQSPLRAVSAVALPWGEPGREKARGQERGKALLTSIQRSSVALAAPESTACAARA